MTVFHLFAVVVGMLMQASCSAANPISYDPTDVYPTILQFNCAENRFTPVFITMAGDAGGQAADSGDKSVFTVQLTSVDPNSWWSTAFITATVRWL